MQKEIASYIFLRGKVYDYCVYENGKVTRTAKRSLKEIHVAVYLNKGRATIKAGQKEFALKHIVAQCFIKKYKKGLCVICCDGNELNCAVKNLLVCDKRFLGKRTGYLGRAKKIEINGVQYRSVREGAKALFCSHQTLLDYINRKNKNSVLKGVKVRYV